MLRKIIFGFKVFNSFLSKTTSGLSISAIGVPIILPAIISGFFGFPVVVPLIAIYSIVAVLALGIGIYFAFQEYQKLIEQENRILNRYDLLLKDNVPTLEEMPCKQVALVKSAENIYTAYLKWPIYPVSADITLTEEEAAFIQNNQTISAGEEIRKNPLANQIIKKVIAATDAVEKEELSSEQKQIQRWESINAFLDDAPAVFAIASFIIFMITTVCLGTVIPGAFLIAIVISIAYGAVSAYVKNADLDSRFWQIQAFKKQYDTGLTTVNGLISDVVSRIEAANNRIERAEKLLKENLFGTDQLEKDSFQSNLALTKVKQSQLATLRTRLGNLRGRLQANEALYFEFTYKDIFKIGFFGLVLGGISAASFVYLALPLLVSALGFPPLSLPILITIVVVVGLAYGLNYMYHSANAIKEEKWENIDNQEFTEVDQLLLKDTQSPEESMEEQALEEELKTLEEQLKVLEKRLAEREPTVDSITVEDMSEASYHPSDRNILDLSKRLAEEAKQTFYQFFGNPEKLNNNKQPTPVTTTPLLEKTG